MNFSTFKPKDFSTRLILLTFISGIIPLIIFFILIHNFSNRLLQDTSVAIEQGQSEQWRRSQIILDQLAENHIRQKALDVALQIELYLQAHPTLDIYALQKDQFFRDIAIQPVGQTGYTAVHESETAINRFHNNPQTENSDLHDLSEKLPAFWKIIKGSLNGRYSHGYYSWLESDGKESEKYMYIVPVRQKTADGTFLSVGATAYMPEFKNAVQAAINVSNGTSHLLIKTTRSQIRSLKATGYLYMGLSTLLILLFASWTGFYFSRTIRKLSEATNAVNKGNFDIQLQPLMSGDVGKLIDDFNKMIQRLAATTVKKDKFEELVQERTQELIDINLKLQDSEQKMRAILQASPVGIGLILDRELSWANEKMYQILGYEEDSLVGQDSRILYPSDSHYEEVGQKLYAQLSRSETTHIITKWRRKNGTLFDCSLNGCFLNPNEPEMGVIIAATDITEAKKLEDKLSQAQKMEALGTLAGGVAHDLNNILSGLVSYPELLLLDTPEDSPLRKPLLTIKRSGEEAAAIVQDLLTITRRGVAQTEVININSVIKAQLDSPEYDVFLVHHPDTQIITHLEENLSNIKGSAPHLAKSFMNLLNNAAEAIAEGGKIVISTANISITSSLIGFEKIEPGQYVSLSINDNGEGIPEDDLGKIFEPFFTKKKMGRSGSGLGMTVVWGTVKDLNGYIDINSSPGEGTIITLYFPITDDLKPPSKNNFTLSTYQGDLQKILVVDDSESQREIAQSILESLNYHVISLPSGEDAVRYLRDHDVDLLFLDMIMDPGIDGLETYCKIKVFKPGIKTIIASGYSESVRLKEVQKLSNAIFLKKPYTLERISEAVHSTLY
ncbi:ATP-binding protein [Desulfopila sp. IMCC35008]|uniref:hybrid sensor histidine kinase/response regulator n=1 Tax=Desulfopila sp. IMCC35008 TaxID=2653858 RepID=UPI0013D51C20|nr:ATP-binding protein [Desulfopila sp. IMCC35008]